MSSFAKALGAGQQALRDVVQTAVAAGIPVPALSASLAYYDCVSQRAAAGESHAGAARFLWRAHLSPRRSRRRLSHRVDTRMSDPLEIPAKGDLDFLVAGRAGPSPRFRRLSVSQGAVVRHSRQRRRVQHGGESRGLLRHAHGRRERDGRLSGRRSHRRARARDGRAPVLQAVQARRRARPEHGGRLQRSRPWRARAGRVLQPQQRSGGAAEAGRLRLEGDLRRAACAGSTAAASSRRCPRRRPSSSSRRCRRRRTAAPSCRSI